MKYKRYWYISLMAGIYAIICGATSVYCIAQDFRSDGATIPIAVQLLCFALTVSAIVYFVRAAVGSAMLSFFTAMTIVAIGTTDPKATVFHVVVLAIFMLPIVASRWKVAGA
jgi:hypothetical protein